MAVGLRHNHDISLILTRSKGLSLMWYICNYATKLNAPMWKRLAIASEMLELVRQQQGRLRGA
ncbi:PIF1 protein [Apiospora arundinis]